VRRPHLKLFALLTLLACGSRTGLYVDEVIESVDAAPDIAPVLDARPDVRVDAGPDARDATRDVNPDVVRDVTIDSLPPIDVTPVMDVFKPIECADASTTFIYLIGENNDLYSFNPATLTLKPIGNISCPNTAGSPFSMAVDRRGVAYVVFSDGNLFRVSTLTAACSATPFAVGQAGFQTFGMGFAANTSDPGETLYVAGSSDRAVPEGLGKIDTQTFGLTPLGILNPEVNRMELTGTGDGRLFGFSPDNNAPYIAQIDKGSADLLSRDPVVITNQTGAFAFSFWGGKFYAFTADPGSSTLVTQYDPATKVSTVVTQLPTVVVGAGVSTCAPSE
jgi:hypothetical protein